MSPPPSSQIVAVGGLGSDEENLLLTDYVIGATGKGRPKVSLLPTATGDDATVLVHLYELFSGRADCSHVLFHPWPPADLRERLLESDVVWVSGGNTANMLAIWRLHGVDSMLRDAWENGVVLGGWSAGMICWFEAGVTDSFGPDLAGMRDGLGFLSGSACPHYDGEERRRPVYERLVSDGFPPGYAADDCVVLCFTGTELTEIVSARDGAGAYRVEREGEVLLEARALTRR
jgi:dipeptidase E